MNRTKKPIKLCMIITDVVSFNTLCQGQLEFLRDTNNFDITLICGGSEEQLEVLRSRKVGQVLKIPLVRQPAIFTDLKCLLRLFTYFVFNRFDLVIFSTPKALLLGSIASYFTFQKNRTALVRGRVYENYRGIKRKFFALLDKICLRFSNQVIFISHSLKKVYVDENLVSDSKTIIVNQGSSNGVNILSFVPLNEKLNSTFKILVIGRICHDKGINDLLEILSKIDDLNIEVKIVGKVEDTSSQNILNQILENYNFVEYISFTSSPIRFFQEADLHLFLSHREGFGNVALEAASCNVPTFAYDVVGIKDSVKNNVSGLKFTFKDTDGVAQAIRESVLNPLEFKRKFSNSRSWVIENFNQKNVWLNYANLYLDIVEGRLNHK
ncbi:glycosyltransferase [Acinetobacter indicus]|nr:glycosyltransferase [Acinetobacter indicus]